MRKSLLIIALVLTLSVTFCLASFVSFAEDLTVTVTQADGATVSVVEGENTLSDDDGVITLDAENRTVTLNNVTAKSISLASGGNFTVEVVGENTFTNTSAQKVFQVTSGDVTIKGSGTLAVNAASNALYVAAGSYVQEDATLNLTNSGELISCMQKRTYLFPVVLLPGLRPLTEG